MDNLSLIFMIIFRPSGACNHFGLDFSTNINAALPLKNDLVESVILQENNAKKLRSSKTFVVARNMNKSLKLHRSVT
jgi:hypothetical protein